MTIAGDLISAIKSISNTLDVNKLTARIDQLNMNLLEINDSIQTLIVVIQENVSVQKPVLTEETGQRILSWYASISGQDVPSNIFTDTKNKPSVIIDNG